MKRLINILAVFIICLVCLVHPILASNISNAVYRGQINVVNNGYASAKNVTPFTLNAQSLVDLLYINPDYSNVAIVDRNNIDVAFMPPFNYGNEWLLWVPDINQYNTMNYYMYAGGSTEMNGKIAYFPDTSGMTTNNSNSLQIGSNPFRIEMSGYFDSTQVGALPLNKAGSLLWTYDQSESIRALGYAITNDTIQLTGAVNGNNATTALNSGGQWVAQSFTLTSSAILVGVSSSSIQLGNPTLAWLDLYAFDGTTSSLSGTPIATSNAITNAQSTFTFNTQPILSAGQYAFVIKSQPMASSYVRVQYRTDPANYSGGNVFTTTSSGATWFSVDGSIFNLALITAPPNTGTTALPAGEHTVALVYDGTNLMWEIDGSITYSAAVPGFNVPVNTNQWQLLQNGSVPYMERYRVWINGTLVQDISWRDNPSVFSDASGNNNNAYPSFVNAPTNPQITATMVRFEAINPNPGGIPPTTNPGGAGGIGGNQPITDVPDDPDISGFGAHQLPNIPFIGQPVADFFDAKDWPYALFVFPLMVILLLITTYVTYAITHDLAWMGAGSFIVAGLFIALKLLLWVWLFPMTIVLAFCIVKRRAIQL
ncbi:MAG: hypothetical protein FWH42_01490 [Dehalococcoidia bacterium]|nr:hypothetical protein [Dehalococcoidia bacterium]